MLHIATAFSKPELLVQVHNSIPKHSDITWHIAKSKYTPALQTEILNDCRVKIYEVDCLDEERSAKRNIICDHIKDGYVYFLDDDTIFLEAAYDVYKKYSAVNFVGMIVGNQKYGKNEKIFNRIKSSSLNVIERENKFPVYIIDTGMVICHYSAINHVRWANVKVYGFEDCLFWSQCFQYFGKERVLLIDTVVSYFNYFGPKIRFRKKIGNFKINFDIKKPIFVLVYKLFEKTINTFRKKEVNIRISKLFETK